MKKILYITVLLLTCMTDAEATFSGELRGAATFPTNNKFRHIFGDVIPSYQIELGWTFWKTYGLFLNVDELYRKGSLDHCGKSSLNILTASFGPKYIYPLNTNTDLYTGIGVSVAWSQIDNKKATKAYNTSVGFCLKNGAYYYFSEQFFLDLFVDYGYQPAFRNHINIGGFKTGVGVGYLY